MRNQVLITFATKTGTAAYPLAVVITRDGKEGMETLVRSVREGRIYGNGVCHAGLLAEPGEWPINPSIDPRLGFDQL